MSGSRDDDHHETPSRDLGADNDYLMPEADEMIRRVMNIIDSTSSMPMSSTVKINKEEILEMLGDALDRFPEELRQAKWLLKDRDAFLADRQREGQAIVERASVNAARLVEKREIVKNAQARAEQIVEEAERTARRRRREADDYCDQQLARFENALEKLHRQVGKMRDRLAAPTIEESELGASAQANADAKQSRSGPRTGQTRAVRPRPPQQRPQASSGQTRSRQGQPGQRRGPVDTPRDTSAAGGESPSARPTVFDQDL